MRKWSYWPQADKALRITFALLLSVGVLLNAAAMPASAAPLPDSDGDGTPDSLEGYCATAELFTATTSYPTGVTFVSNPTPETMTINPTGGTSTSSVAITLDRTGREQVKFNNALNFYHLDRGGHSRGRRTPRPAIRCSHWVWDSVLCRLPRPGSQ